MPNVDPEQITADYTAVRKRLSDLALTLSDDELATSVPACPGWTVKDIVAHLTGTAGDLGSGNFPKDQSWTANQVESRKAKSLEDTVFEWADNAPGLMAAVEGPIAGFAWVLVPDVVSHELDVRNALGRKDGRDTPELSRALEVMATAFGERVAKAGLPAVKVVAGDVELIAGDGDPAVTVKTSAFDMLRAVTSRRTPDEIKTFDWDGDPAPYIEHMAPFPFPEAALGE